MQKEDHEKMLKLAVLEALENAKNGYLEGGPFGAIIVKDDKIIAKAHNSVIKDNDLTAHAETNAIRKASQKLGTHNLEGAILYTSSEPCPMCLSAIIWANIKEVYYGNSKEETDKIGFRDDFIYDYLKHNKQDILNIKQIHINEAQELYNDFLNCKDKIIY